MKTKGSFYYKVLFYTFVAFIIIVWKNHSFGYEWSKTFGGSGYDLGDSVQQTADGGFIIAGQTSSFGAGGSDVYLIKTDGSGSEQWSKTFGGSDYDYGRSVQQTADGGFIIAGFTDSFGAGASDVYLIKTDNSGSEQWSKTFGGSNYDYGYSVQQTADGGFIIVGDTLSFGAGEYDQSDLYLIKTDNSGSEQWSKTFGGSDDDYGRSVQQTADGGFIIAGQTSSFGAGGSDVYLIKTDGSGSEQWSKTLGRSENDYGYSVQQTADFGFIIVGQTGGDVYLIKTDNSGNEQWSKTFGGIYWDGGRSVQQTADGGFIIVGSTSSFGADFTDVYLIKTEGSGSEQWSKTFGGIYYDGGYSVRQTADGGFIIVGAKDSFGAGGPDVYLIYFKPDDQDLLYTPVNPCRIVDTRKAGYAISAGGIFSYNVRGAVASQGGNPSGCPSPKGEPRAVHVNITSVPLGNGWITAYPYGSTAPTASLVNYRSDAQNVANSGTIKTCSNCTKDINIKSVGGTTYVIIDVLGYYYSKP